MVSQQIRSQIRFSWHRLCVVTIIFSSIEKVVAERFELNTGNKADAGVVPNSG